METFASSIAPPAAMPPPRAARPARCWPIWRWCPSFAGRERLAGLLWSDRGEEQARASLRQTLAELRGLPVGEALAIARRDVSLIDGALDSDIAHVISAARSGDLARLSIR